MYDCSRGDHHDQGYGGTPYLPGLRYDLGFHTSFTSTSADTVNPVRSTREVYRVILICPECGARYDVGWRVSFPEPENKVVNATVLHDL